MTPGLRAALEGWLALEHEAVWWFGTIGGRFDDLRDAARDSYDQHRAARDRLVAVLAGRGPAPRIAYGPVPDSAAEARSVAADVEQRLCSATLTVIGVAEGDERVRPLAALRRAALAALDWDADPVAFPGLD